MNDELALKAQEALGGADDADFARALEADPAALAEYADQLAIHHRLGVALDPDATSLRDSVLREVRNIGDSGRFAGAVVDRLKDQRRRRVLELLAAAVLLGALGFFLWNRRETAVPAAAGGDIVLVVGQLPLDAGDVRVKDRLERSHRVAVRLAKDARPDEPASLVVISSTVDERDLKDTYRASATPVLCWEPRLYHDLGLCPGTVYHRDWGTTPDQTRLSTRAGSVVVTSRPAPVSWGKVRADAVVVATIDGDPSKAAIFHGEQGLPGRRAGMFLFEWSPMALTDDGWKLFDDEVRWCLGR